MAIDRKFLDANHADLVAAIRAEGQQAGLEEGRAQGAQAERARIQAVEAQALPGHEALIGSLKFDGKTTGPEAAAQVVAAEKQKNAGALDKLRMDGGADLKGVAAGASQAGDAAAQAAAAEAAAEAGLSVEERAKKRFERDAQIRAEFGTVERYAGWLKHEEKRKSA